MKKAWSILPEEWKPILTERGLRAFRADQILQALYRDYITDWDQATTLPKDFRETLKQEFPLTRAETLEVAESADGTKKLLLGFADGQSVETVLIPATGRFTQCISTQVGCAMGCAFCASGSQGVVRSLAADEIVAEYMAGRRLGEITNIVVMGMGEPFANYDETLRALKLINAGRGPNLGARHITLSTCGVVPGFARLADEGIQFELSVSLHAPNDALRSQLMPVNKRWPLDELLAACADYTAKTKRIITFEYTVIKNSMIHLATEALPYGEQLKSILEGPTAVAFGYEDMIAPAKIASEYGKKTKKLAIKGGACDGAYLDEKGVQALAELPSKEVLIARFMGSLMSSVSAFARVVEARRKQLAGEE